MCLDLEKCGWGRRYLNFFSVSTFFILFDYYFYLKRVCVWRGWWRWRIMPLCGTHLVFGVQDGQDGRLASRCNRIHYLNLHERLISSSSSAVQIVTYRQSFLRFLCRRILHSTACLFHIAELISSWRYYGCTCQPNTWWLPLYKALGLPSPATNTKSRKTKIKHKSTFPL